MTLRYSSVDERVRTTRDRARETKEQRAKFNASIRIERDFARHLRKIAASIGHKVEQFDPMDAGEMSALQHLLKQYSELIRPWAKAVSRRMLADVSRKDEREWNKVSKRMSEGIRAEVHKNSVTGKLLRALHAEQVELITSLPLEAAQRVHDLTLKGLESSVRAADIAREIMRSGEVTKSRANLIARTEVARTSSLLTESRAKSIGSEGYIWRTSRDQDVRLSHKKMEGKFVRWDSPPTLTDGTTTHAGQIYNCFPSDVLVVPDDGIRKVFRASYVGELVTLRAGKTTLKVTPNHPILTPGGWVAAGLLQVGDDLIQVLPESWDIGEDNDDKGLSSFGEIFELLAADMETRMTAPINDFYGDVVHGDIKIVRTKFDLSLDYDAKFFDLSRDDMIPRAHGRVLSAGSVRRIPKILETLDACLGDIFNSLFRSSDLGHSLVGVGSGSLGDTTLLENVTDRGDRTVISLGESGSAVARDVVSDYLESREVRSRCSSERLGTLRITDRSMSQFSGHVFTLETVRGHYRVTPAGIIAKNCRCYPEPVIPDDI